MILTLPIFPLPDTVFFPNTMLPLHIFEPRYKKMIAHVLEGDQMLGVVQLRPGWHEDYFAAPPVYKILGVGKIIDVDKWPDGRYDIVLSGVYRTQLIEELLHEAQQLLNVWLQTKGFLAKAFTESPVSHEEEKAFLETKSAVSQYTRTVSQKLPPDVKIGGEKMQELLRQAISISHLRGLPKADKQTLIANWHAAFVSLARAVGCLQFIVEGYLPTAKAAKTGTGIRDLKGGKKKKQGPGAGKIILRLIILAAIAAAAWYFMNR